MEGRNKAQKTLPHSDNYYILLCTLLNYYFFSPVDVSARAKMFAHFHFCERDRERAECRISIFAFIYYFPLLETFSEIVFALFFSRVFAAELG